MTRKTTTSTQYDIFACIQNGMSCREAAAHCGVSVATAIRWTKRAGLTSLRSRLLSPQTRVAVTEAMRAGGHPAEVAARLGVGQATARRLNPVANARRNRQELHEALFTALRDGLSRRQAAAAVGVSVATAIRWARAGVARAALDSGLSLREAANILAPRQPTTPGLARRKRVDPEREAKRKRLLDAIGSGLSRRQAAAAVGLPVATAIRWARRLLDA